MVNGDSDLGPAMADAEAQERVPEAGAAARPGLEGAPAMSPQLREAARLAPEHWLAMTDPGWTGEGPPPPFAVMGQVRSGPDGEIQEWRANDEHRPSPVTRGWPAPTDEIDEAIQLAVTGYGPGEDVVRLLATAEVAFPVDPAGQPLVGSTVDGIPALPVYTSAPQVAALGRLAHEAMPVTRLLTLLTPGQRLLVNPEGAACLLMESEALTRAETGTEQPAGGGGG
ncbi:type VII secretion system-associated protein [Streptomyces sp. NBC_01176]|uniref:type VII secretion system-associated protein n=1 Tax=Streptomyces sp. NBC_01176 TaxID=2903760 RepID=UPI002F90835F|nr:type VII secretion system-associated protein [Streptomyces sp. NBC_01176]